MSDPEPTIPPESLSWPNVHPDFDGHLEKPLEKMTTTEKLEWLWEIMLFQHWVKTQVKRVDETRSSDRNK